MAGDWIKIEKATVRKPEVLRVAMQLGIHPDHAFGLCFRFWSWCDDNLENGNAVGVTSVMLDALLERDGIADALIKAGWLLVRNGSLEVPNYDRHLSDNAKKRGLSQVRTAKSRSRKCNAQSVTEALPEKRREEKSIKEKNNPRDGIRSELLKDSEFAALWDEWHRHRIEKFKPLGAIEEQNQLKDLDRQGLTEAMAIVNYTIKKGAVNLIDNGDHRQQSRTTRRDVKDSSNRATLEELREAGLA